MREKILIIDDEPELVKAVQIRLETSGYEVEIAYDGQTGLKKAEEIKPDLILLDIIIPNVDGYEVCRELKDNPKTKNIPIIILSASHQKDLENKCKKLDVTKIISKPFETNDLLDIINQTLKKRGRDG